VGERFAKMSKNWCAMGKPKIFLNGLYHSLLWGLYHMGERKEKSIESSKFERIKTLSFLSPKLGQVQ
jgi:hypothetical protein